VPFRTEFDDVLKRANLYRGTALPDGRFVIATIGAGFAIIDREGRVLLHLTSEDGLPSDTIYYVEAGREGALWLGSDHGIGRVESSSAVSFFDRTDNMP